MSIFDKNIVEKELDYRADPCDNISFQLIRYFNRLCDEYTPPQYVGLSTSLTNDVISYIENKMNKVLNILYLGELDPSHKQVQLPNWWNGPAALLTEYSIDTSNPFEEPYWWRKPDTGVPEIHIKFEPVHSDKQECLNLCINIVEISNRIYLNEAGFN